MKIKIIDLLNKIANNEEVPEKIMFDEWLYIYNEREKTYYDEEDRTLWQSYNFKILFAQQNKNTGYLRGKNI